MSAGSGRLRYTVQCDTCGTEYKPVGVNPVYDYQEAGPPVYRYQQGKGEVVNRLLADAGWTVDGDNHICPDCPPSRPVC